MVKIIRSNLFDPFGQKERKWIYKYYKVLSPYPVIQDIISGNLLKQMCTKTELTQLLINSQPNATLVRIRTKFRFKKLSMHAAVLALICLQTLCRIEIIPEYTGVGFGRSTISI